MKEELYTIIVERKKNVYPLTVIRENVLLSAKLENLKCLI